MLISFPLLVALQWLCEEYRLWSSQMRSVLHSCIRIWKDLTVYWICLGNWLQKYTDFTDELFLISAIPDSSLVCRERTSTSDAIHLAWRCHSPDCRVVFWWRCSDPPPVRSKHWLRVSCRLQAHYKVKSTHFKELGYERYSSSPANSFQQNPADSLCVCEKESVIKV